MTTRPRLQAEAAAELNALLPAILDRARKGGLWMTMPSQVSVTCEQSAKEHPFTARESLHVALDRDVAEQRLKGERIRLLRVASPAA